MENCFLLNIMINVTIALMFNRFTSVKDIRSNFIRSFAMSHPVVLAGKEGVAYEYLELDSELNMLIVV